LLYCKTRKEKADASESYKTQLSFSRGTAELKSYMLNIRP
jgi:hypothetical protein